MRRAIVTSTATVSGILLLLGLKSHPAGATSGSGTDLSAPVIGSSSGNEQSAPSTGSPSASSPSANATAVAGSRVITGSAVDTRYGPVQVKVTFNGKKIAGIDVVEYPTESRRDQQINQYAIPVLNQEALAAQSAKIDAVSGATYTSDGYTGSLQSAIDQAGA